MTAVLALLLAAASGTAVVLAIRMGGLREQLAETEAARLRESAEREEAVEGMRLAVAELERERARYELIDARRAREIGAVQDRLAATIVRCRDHEGARDLLGDALAESEAPHG